MTRVIPTLMIILSVLSAVCYALQDITNWRAWGYWLASAAITFCVTW